MKNKLIFSLLVILFGIFFISGCIQMSIPDASPDSQGSQTSAENVPVDTFMLRIGAASKEAINYHDVASIAVLVNKQNQLPSDYVPPDLVEVNIPFTFKEKAEKRMLRQEAAAKLEELFSAAKENGVIFYGVSGYRSYQTQQDLFASFTRRYGTEEKANQISARPGESEHQTGLAMDVSCQSVNFGLEETFGDTDEYVWLKDNAHRFGFIIRYPKGKEYLTEYTYEPWHLRYIGQDLATKLYEQHLTYEEYLFFKI
ncbi:D-alanyl-D-alanine carboxypeptidase [Dehalobacter sp. UNSWDHB]|jgi:D-alanyl-D-alanine carboxypeptidase|uniref:M15 family metallopeptidase n=1 Tax=unclassified Dehalobacter TaxID=2635733 RepID=UPI00028A943D|nr:MULTISPECIES: M15 family metallopeptidase [unclassified Dehalobacter]AFV02853.1 D-alanyl-D-alanine carboxypeptidase [Dehalobacter sp. DCA]AFV05840.1 D-alanyl-D-alanine carboxypeptidase [Dehalobacter sp. CF]EQB22462.1 D-alanyl-D-alanine carboxypeptidase [Dehalobacter sp. UNSWDHB]